MNARNLLVKTVNALYKCSLLGARTKYTFGRHAMYKRLEALAPKLPREGKVLSISYSLHLCEIMNIKATEIVECNYPDGNILSLPDADNTFDFVLSDQVFEHIEGSPQRAIDECLRVLKPGGYMVHTTCMMTSIHGPGDFWRFTPEGLVHLCKAATRIVDADGWGHPLVPLFTFLGFVWTPIPDGGWHPINYFATVNRKSYPFVVWVIAQK